MIAAADPLDGGRGAPLSIPAAGSCLATPIPVLERDTP